MAMTLNDPDNLVLLNVANQGVHLWDIRELTDLIARTLWCIKN